MRRRTAIGAAVAGALGLTVAVVSQTPTTTTLAVTYTEPGFTTEDYPLNDLKATRVHYAIEGGASGICAEIPATSRRGGGRIETTCVVPVGTGQRATVALTVTAVDLWGNVSPPHEAVRVTLEAAP